MTIAVIAFIIGILCLLFGETKNPTWNIIGFILVIGAFIYVGLQIP